MISCYPVSALCVTAAIVATGPALGAELPIKTLAPAGRSAVYGHKDQIRVVLQFRAAE
jgi:hypothetical protein